MFLAYSGEAQGDPVEKIEISESEHLGDMITVLKKKKRKRKTQ